MFFLTIATDRRPPRPPELNAEEICSEFQGRTLSESSCAGGVQLHQGCLAFQIGETEPEEEPQSLQAGNMAINCFDPFSLAL